MAFVIVVFDSEKGRGVVDGWLVIGFCDKIARNRIVVSSVSSY